MSVYPAEGPSVRLRLAEYVSLFKAAGINLEIQSLLTSQLYRRRRRFGGFASLYKIMAFAYCTLRLLLRLWQVRRYDAIIIHREAFPLGPPLIERLIQALCPRVFYDVDDAIWEPMPLKIDQRGRLANPDRFDPIMRGCEAVVVGNNYLRTHAQACNPAVHVIPTPYRDLGGAASRCQTNACPVIVWIGNVGNEEYLNLLRGPLKQLAREREFVLRIIGSSEAQTFSIEGVTVETRVWSQAKEGQWLLESDIGVMPLPDRNYERGKCALKIVQYFSAGLAVVASPVGMNSEIIQHRENGYLAAEPYQWCRYLAELLDQPQRRETLGRAGYARYRADYTLEENAAKWLELFNTGP